MDWRALFRTKGIDQITLAANSGTHLKRTLGVWDLTAFGVAAILGAGAFSTMGNAAFEGGPAVVLLFVFTAIACGFSALCYAEFSSSLPIAGSAYTYAYASFGELLAWIIGWDLLMEYAISNIAVAISWSRYFTGLLASYGLNMPAYFTMDYFSARNAFERVQGLVSQGVALSEVVSQPGITSTVLSGYDAWLNAPVLFGLPLIFDLPTVAITVLITWIVLVGIEESKRASNILVLLKVLVVLLVIAVGAFFVQPSNWVPFAPNGPSGVLRGLSAVFFAYIGFDAISTTAEECKNPQRDLPRGMMYALLICTALYGLVALVLTGMVSYTKLGVGDPLAFVFGPEGANLPWLSVIVRVGGVISLATVLLVYQVGQPRIWMAMSRDGLLPPIFSAIHPKYKTPWFSTLLTGVVIIIPSFFMNLHEVTDLTSIGTLFAFMLVCGGVLKLNRSRETSTGFRTPYINSKYWFPLLMISIVATLTALYPEKVQTWFQLNGVFVDRIPGLVFTLGMVVLSYFCVTKNLSLIPVLGVSSCAYLISELGIVNWIRFGIWLGIGFLIYFVYGVRHSKLRNISSPIP